MKKIIITVFLLFTLCFILGACGDQTTVSSESSSSPSLQDASSSSSTINKSEPTSESILEPTGEPTHELSSESTPESTVEPAAEPYSTYPAFERIEKVNVGNGYEEGTVFILSDEEREKLWALLRVEDWTVASDLPVMGFSSAFYIEEGTQTWFFNPYQDQTLIVPSFPDQNGEKICYFSSADVITDVLAFTNTLTP